MPLRRAPDTFISSSLSLSHALSVLLHNYINPTASYTVETTSLSAGCLVVTVIEIEDSERDKMSAERDCKLASMSLAKLFRLILRIDIETRWIRSL